MFPKIGFPGNLRPLSDASVSFEENNLTVKGVEVDAAPQ